MVVGVQGIEAVGVEPGFELVEDLGEGAVAVDEVFGGVVDGVGDGAGLAGVDELLDGAEVDGFAAVEDAVAGLDVDLDVAAAAGGVEALA